MATFNTSFLYALDQNGNSTNGHVDELIPSSAAVLTESIDNGDVEVGETFTVNFSNPVTGAIYDGTYTFVGYVTDFSAPVGQDQNGEYFLFTNNGSIPIGQNLTGFVAEDFPVCYHRGTLIACPDGEHPIESLEVGDLILTYHGQHRAIKWIGRRAIDLTCHPHPNKVRPVIFRAGSLADNVPNRDLRVSPGHAMFIDGCFVHAYRLINGTSILADPDIRSARYYHIELETHDILLAEGAASETYVDMNNRGWFQNSSGPVDLHPTMVPPTSANWWEAFCAPFLLDAVDVEPLWHRLSERAKRCGNSKSWSQPQITDDAELSVRVNGRDIPPTTQADGRYVFVLPATTQPVQLVSRATAPNALWPWAGDSRRLGVAVRYMTIRCGDDDLKTILADNALLTVGWWQPEIEGSCIWRWTKGRALVPGSFEQPCVLEVMTGPQPAHRANRPAVTPAA